MRKNGLFFVACVLMNIYGYSQSIPYGISYDTLQVEFYDSLDQGAGSYVYITLEDTGLAPFEIYYYKPPDYDSVNSPILWYIHGSGATGAEGPAVFSATADRQKALVVAVTMQNGYPYCNTWLISNNHQYFIWYPLIFKQVYKHILARENRDSIPVYLTGFSAGGQCVSRYMLIRQGFPDSIPIIMSASANSYSYTFCTDTLDGVFMNYPCGLGYLNFCKEFVMQYYNENYAVLIGTTDTAAGSMWPCIAAQGNNRYDRAQNFYAFSDSNAVNRGTTLKWQYTEVPGIGHNGYAMYQTPAAGDSIPIAERLLFETPWHPVPSFAPVANFNYTDSALIVTFSDSSQNTNNWFWDFGDGDNSLSQNPVHTFTASGIYNVCLTAGDTCSSDTYCDSITVIGVGINTVTRDEKFIIIPNPTTGKITINGTSNIASIKIYNIFGDKIFISTIPVSSTIDISNFSNGIYFLTASINGQIQTFKLIKM